MSEKSDTTKKWLFHNKSIKTYMKNVEPLMNANIRQQKHLACARKILQSSG